MKSVLLLLLVCAVGFLAYQNNEKQQALKLIQEASEKQAEENQAKTQREQAETKAKTQKEQAQKLVSERDQLLRERETLTTERDEARQLLTAANNEIARLTHTTPKPQSWFERRIEKSTATLDAPPTPQPRPGFPR